MKTRVIRRFQRWATTIISPTLEPVDWKTELLNKKIAWVERNLDEQIAATKSLMTAVLFDRWRKNDRVLHSRSEFGYWLNYLGLHGDGVEIGVYRGEYSKELLRTWQGRCLYSIDPWKEFEEQDYKDICNVSQYGQDENFAITSNRLQQFGARSRILRKTSAEAVNDFEDQSLDFVYIDAQHHYEAVKADINLWDVKVKPGGVVGGHDYLDGMLPSGDYGVIRAVEDWSRKVDVSVIVTREGPYPSWFAIKNG